MAELTVDDVAQYNANLSADDDETQRMLDAALSAARHDCGWHVSPARTETWVLDGRGGTRLWLPTQRIVEVTEVIDDGVTLELAGSGVDAADVDVVVAAPGLLVRQNGYWCNKYGGVTVTLTHGYTEAEAADWRQAVLQMVSDMSSGTGRSDADLVAKQVDDVSYRWGPTVTEAAYRAESVLGRYRLQGGWA